MKYQVLFIAVLLIMAALIAGCTQQAGYTATDNVGIAGRNQGRCHRIADRPGEQCRHQHVAVGTGRR